MRQGIRIVAALLLVIGPVLVESSCGEMFEHCPDVKQFSITNFNVRAVKSNESVYAPAPVSAKPPAYLFLVAFDSQLAMERRITMGAYADCAPAESIETATGFSITSDNDLVTSDSTFVAGSDIQSIISYEFVSMPFVGEKFFAHEYKFTPSFSVPSAQKHTITFNIALSDGRTFAPQLPAYEFLPD